MPFDQAIYNAIRGGIQSSARVLAPMILNATAREDVRVLDVGGGEGWWSDALLDAGARDALVLDSPLPPKEQSASTSRLEFNLEDKILTLPRGYDVALCLEVAEHLDRAAGDRLVHELCRAAPLIAWSAAIPGQGGSGHVNEQWPAYWSERFAANGYAFLDPFRMAVWGDERVEPWYQQNLLLAARGAGAVPVPPLVHPTIYLHRHEDRSLR